MSATVSILLDKRIILGVTGSIACYKVVDLASKLTQAGSLVDVVLTKAATEFVQPLSFQSVTGRRAQWDMWNMDDHIQHVRLGEAADFYLIAPATANTMAKLAHGLADNLVLVTALAARCPVAVAPAMDVAMFDADATQANLNILRKRGILVFGPAEGRMASGLMGKGRMIEPAEMIGHIRYTLSRAGILRGKHIVVTAGPTQEPLDPVRFLTNLSSGKQGFALAQAALDSGADVTLITGPVNLSMPVGVQQIPVRTAVEMRDTVLAHVQEADALMMAAAVADFRPQNVALQKIKKTNKTDPAITLTGNPDILLEVKSQKEKTGRPFVTLGFAAETEQLLAYGSEKLRRKGLDFIAINDVSGKNTGFGTDTNRVILLEANGQTTESPRQSKANVAEFLVQKVAEKLLEANQTIL